MNMNFTPRTINAAGFLGCALLLAYAWYAQLVLGLEPCPLCIFQRVGFIVLALVFLLVTLHAPRGMTGRRVYAGLLGTTAAIGAAISTRHVWLQNLPADEVPACGPGLDYMLDVFPLGETLRMVFTGSGECAEVDWVFLGLSMPAWALIAFVMLGGIGVWNNARRVN